MKFEQIKAIKAVTSVYHTGWQYVKKNGTYLIRHIIDIPSQAEEFTTVKAMSREHRFLGGINSDQGDCPLSIDLERDGLFAQDTLRTNEYLSGFKSRYLERSCLVLSWTEIIDHTKT